MELPIIYKDRAIAVCLKPTGADSEALPALLAAQLRVREAFCVHRLDKAVGGVMVCALNRESAAALSEQIRVGRFEKEYRAVVHGTMEARQDTLRDLLFYDRAKGKSFVVKRERAGVKSASLEYRVLAEAEGLSLLSVRLHTGRTHQIRVQLATRGHPLVGDARYGSPRRDCGVALFSRALGFAHPFTGEKLRFTAPTPGGFPWNLFDGGIECDTLK